MNKNDIAVYKTTSEYFTSIESTYETRKFHMPIAMTSDEKCFYICDHYNNRIVIFYYEDDTWDEFEIDEDWT